MRIESEPKLDFDDVLIRPKRSRLKSRSEVDVRRTFKTPHSGVEITGVPIIAANMDTTGNFEVRILFLLMSLFGESRTTFFFAIYSHRHTHTHTHSISP